MQALHAPDGFAAHLSQIPGHARLRERGKGGCTDRGRGGGTTCSLSMLNSAASRPVRAGGRREAELARGGAEKQCMGTTFTPLPPRTAAPPPRTQSSSALLTDYEAGKCTSTMSHGTRFESHLESDGDGICSSQFDFTVYDVSITQPARSSLINTLNYYIGQLKTDNTYVREDKRRELPSTLTLSSRSA